MWGGHNSVRDRDQGWNAFESVKAVIWENLHLRSERGKQRWEIQEKRLLGKPEKSKFEAEPGSSGCPAVRQGCLRSWGAAEAEV